LRATPKQPHPDEILEFGMRRSWMIVKINEYHMTPEDYDPRGWDWELSSEGSRK
jgi:hypothetical protein